MSATPVVPTCCQTPDITESYGFRPKPRPASADVHISLRSDLGTFEACMCCGAVVPASFAPDEPVTSLPTIMDAHQ